MEHQTPFHALVYFMLGQHGEIQASLSVSRYKLFMIDALGWSKEILKQLTVVKPGLMVMVMVIL